MRSVPSWLIAMFAGVFGAALAGSLGASAFGALIVALLAGLLALRSLRYPPWTASGRMAWRLSARRWHSRARELASRLRRRSGQSGSFGGASAEPPWAASGPPDGGDAWEARPSGRLPVRCELVTPRLQVWHSTVTKRAYEVPNERGLAQAEPGMLAELVFERGRPRVVPREVN